MSVPLGGTPTWRLHTKLYKFGLNISPNISRAKNRTDLEPDLNFCMFVLFSPIDSWLYTLIGFDFYFWWRDSKNQELLTYVAKQWSHDQGYLGSAYKGPVNTGGLQLSMAGWHRSRCVFIRSGAMYLEYTHMAIPISWVQDSSCVGLFPQ